MTRPKISKLQLFCFFCALNRTKIRIYKYLYFTICVKLHKIQTFFNSKQKKEQVEPEGQPTLMAFNCLMIDEHKKLVDRYYMCIDKSDEALVDFVDLIKGEED